MSYRVCQIDGESWAEKYSEAFHASGFGATRAGDMETADFAIMVLKDDKALGYIQCIETSKDVLYWQFGAMFSDSLRTAQAVPAIMKAMDWSLERYQRIETRIESSNIRALHLEMKMGFRICGTKTVGNKVYAELFLERN